MATDAISPRNLSTSSHGLPQILRGDPPDATLTALSTLSLLNLRLSRLEFLLTGSSSSHDADLQLPARQNSAHARQSVLSQIQTLSTRLENLKRLDGLPGSLVRMVDTLRREYPEIFNLPSTNSTSESANTKDLSRHADEVLAHATLYTSTSSRLQTLETLRIPPAAHTANLIEQGPRVRALAARQDRLDTQVDDLTERSVKAVTWWRENEIDGMNELWDDWQERVKACERSIRREERKRRDENM